MGSPWNGCGEEGGKRESRWRENSKKNVWQIYEIHNDVTSTSSVASRDRLVVTTLRCGRSNPGSNPGHGIFFIMVCFLFLRDP